MLLPYLLPRLRDILFLFVFSAVIILGPRMLNQDGDLPRHLAMGRTILQSGTVPTHDIFSFTNAGKPFAPHEWLAGLIFYCGYALIGLNGIVILAAIFLAASFTMIYTKGVSSSSLRLPVFFLVAWGAAISSLHWITRPHLFSMLILSVWLILTDRLIAGRSPRAWLLPVIMLLWGNLHGEFIAGFLVLLAYLAGWCWEYLFSRQNCDVASGHRLGLTFVFSFLASCINPVGLRTWSTVLGYLNNSYLISHTNETNPPDFSQPKFLVLLAFIGFSLILLALKREKMRPAHAFLLAGFTILSLISARNVHLYGIVAPFVLTFCLTGFLDIPLFRRLENLFANTERQLKGYFWPIATTLVFSTLLIVTPLGNANRFNPAFYPVQAVTWLKQNPIKGEVFNAFDWGGYILLNFWPEKRVFIDSQTDVYGEAFTRKYEHVLLLEDGWQTVFSDYNVSWVLVPPDWPLAHELAKQPGWQTVYQDDTAVILQMKSPIGQ